MKQVKIVSGVSGSGKSHLAKAIAKEAISLGAPHLAKCSSVRVVSADDYFMVDGVYVFDVSKLSAAHGACFASYIEGLQEECELVVVDNTNTTAVEIAPYILGAQAYGYEAEILTVMCETDDDVLACAARNSHGVPVGGIWAQHRRLCGRELMPWWKNTFQRVVR